MEINVRDDSRLVKIWLTNSEKQDTALLEKLKPLYQAYTAKNYLVVVFVSGGQDLVQATSDLLCYNRRHMAELAAQREHTRRQTQI